MTRERIELNRQDDSRKPPRVTPLRSGASEFSAPDEPEEISSRVIDLDLDDEAQFLRTQRRIPVRRGPLQKKTFNRVKAGAKVAVVLVMGGMLVITAYGYAEHAARFRIQSSDDIEISGVRNASRAQVMEIAGSDIGRNIFFVPLQERRQQLERIPWVQSASVMRLMPNRIAVDIAERTPVAKVQIGSRISLIDAGGVVMGPPASRQSKYSFPVIHGIAESEPLSSRAAAMKTYNRLIRELEADPSEQYVKQLSEVDLSDPEDVKVTAGDVGGTVMVYLGNSDFLERYKLFAQHVSEWRKQAGSLQSVDLRYEGQVIVNPDGQAKSDHPRQAATGREIEPSGDHASTAKPNAPGTPGDRKTKAVARNKRGRKKSKSQIPSTKY